MKVRIGASYMSAAKDVVGGSNGLVKSLEMRKRLYILWLDGKGVAHFKESGTGVAEGTKAMMERLTRRTE